MFFCKSKGNITLRTVSGPVKGMESFFTFFFFHFAQYFKYLPNFSTVFNDFPFIRQEF